MEFEYSPLTWELYYQDEPGIEDLKHSLVYTTLELEATIASAKEEITRRECELIHVNDLLSKVMKERDEAKAKCQKLMLEKLELQQEIHHQQHLVQTHQKESTISQSEEDGSSEKNSAQAASSDCEENSFPSSTSNPTQFQVVMELAQKKPLPEKGKFLKAVVEAGPLLQTLLLAGPLPQWQHPPPTLNSIEIPPVSISSPTHSNKGLSLNKKRDLVLSSGVDCPVSKCRKVIQQLPTTPTNVSHHSLPHPSLS